MRGFIREFLKRGLVASVGGPVILAVVYIFLERGASVETITVSEAARGILSSALLAFIAGGINAVYSAERIPLGYAALIHGAVLYTDYILIYLFNGWLESQIVPVAVFTAVFAVGYAVIWLCIYFSIKKKTERLNGALRANKQ